MNRFRIFSVYVLGALAALTAVSGSEFARADDAAVMEVLGSINATLAGEEREWLTISGELSGRQVDSATWERIEPVLPGGGGMEDQIRHAMEMAGDHISPEERAELEALLNDPDNPLADMFAQAGVPQAGDLTMFTLTLTGLDPDSPNMLSERVLNINAGPFDSDQPEQLLNRSLQVDIVYSERHGGGMVPEVFYVSDHDAKPASITFDRLEFGPDGGHAAGQFEASLCRMEAERLMAGPDLDDCRSVSGRFDTALTMKSL